MHQSAVFVAIVYFFSIPGADSNRKYEVVIYHISKPRIEGNANDLYIDSLDENLPSPILALRYGGNYYCNCQNTKIDTFCEITS